MIPTVNLPIDSGGGGSTVTITFPFADLLGSDTLLPSGATFSSWSPPNQPAVTFGSSPKLSGTDWINTVTIADAKAGKTFLCYCTAQTAGGQSLTSQVNVLVVGVNPVGASSTTTPAIIAQISPLPTGNQDWFYNTNARNLSGRFLDGGGWQHNVCSSLYGAVADNTTDCTSAFQSAFNDALVSGGNLCIPPGRYNITNTIVANGKNTAGVNVVCTGGSGDGLAQINYNGPSGTAAFQLNGLNYCTWRGIGLNIGGVIAGVTNQVGFDFTVDSNKYNMGHVRLEDCVIRFQGTGGHHIGVRLGQYGVGLSGQASNISGTILNNLSISGEGSSKGSIGVQLGGSQCKPTLAQGCQFSSLGAQWLAGPIATTLASTIISTTTPLPVIDASLFPTSGTVVLGSSEQVTYSGVDTVNNLIGTTTCVRGANGSTASGWSGGVSCQQLVNNAGLYGGASDLTLIGCGGSANGKDLLIFTPGRFTVQGGRWESGQRFLQTGYNTTNTAYVVSVSGASLVNYTSPADNNGVFRLGGNTNLLLDNCFVSSPTLFGSNFITNNGIGYLHGAVTIRGGAWNASNPFWTLANAWPLNAQNLQLIDLSNTFTLFNQ